MYLFRIKVWSTFTNGDECVPYNVVSENDIRARQKAVEQFQIHHDYKETSYCTIDVIGKVEHIKIDKGHIDIVDTTTD